MGSIPSGGTLKEEYNEYMRKYMLQRYHDRRAFWIQELGGRCTKCSTIEELHFHHVDPATKSFTIGSRLVSASDEVIRAELVKCVLLCRGCHDATHTTWKHGTLAGHRYCKCEACRQAKREYNTAYRARKLGVACNV